MYNSRFSAADLVLESLDDMNGDIPQRFYTFFSDGENIQSDERIETDTSRQVLPVGLADVNGDGFSDLVVRHTETLDTASYRIVYSVYLSIDSAGLVLVHQPASRYPIARHAAPEPALGHLFKQRTRQAQKQEMLVFITPKMITDRGGVR